MNSKHTGFTLIELMVAMAIVGILAATAIVNFGRNEDRDVRQEKDRLTSFLREVQNKALAGDKVGTTLSASEKLCGYGLNQQGESTIQAYYITAPSLDDDCSSNSISKNYDSSHKLEVFSFSNNVKISGSFSDVFFLSPNGKIFYGGNATFTSPITINLTKAGLSSPIPAYIDQSGRIY